MSFLKLVHQDASSARLEQHPKCNFPTRPAPAPEFPGRHVTAFQTVTKENHLVWDDSDQQGTATWPWLLIKKKGNNNNKTKESWVERED